MSRFELLFSVLFFMKENRFFAADDDERNEKEKEKRKKQKQSREAEEKKNVHFLSHTSQRTTA